jgi:uncharacterized membrane protein YtjA (UPF0391 family)
VLTSHRLRTPRAQNQYHLKELQLGFCFCDVKFSQSKEEGMLSWILTFLVIAIVAGLLGFGGIAAASAGIAQTIFYIFLVLLVVSLVFHLARGRSI